MTALLGQFNCDASTGTYELTRADLSTGDFQGVGQCNNGDALGELTDTPRGRTSSRSIRALGEVEEGYDRSTTPMYGRFLYRSAKSSP